MPGNANEKITEDVVYDRSDSFHLLCQYWKLTDAEHPELNDVSHKNGYKVDLDPGMVFLTDSTILENPAGEMRYGKFLIRHNKMQADFDDGATSQYTILKLDSTGLVLSRSGKEAASTLIYIPTHTFWPDAEKNPFSKENYRWAIAPLQSETDAQIKERVKGCLRFYSYYLTGYINGGAEKVDFKSLPCCFNWYWGGIGIQSEKKLDTKWAHCFYSPEQAYKGRQMLDDVILKKYKWDEEEKDWIKQAIPVLLQIRDSL